MDPLLPIKLVILLLQPMLIVGGIVSLFLWWRSGFWAPSHIHRLAVFAGILGLIFAAWLWNIDVPKKENVLWLGAIFPAFVYFYFGLFERDVIKRHLEEKRGRATQTTK